MPNPDHDADLSNPQSVLDAQYRLAVQTGIVAFVAALLTMAVLFVVADDRPMFEPPTDATLNEFRPDVRRYLLGRELDRELYAWGLICFPVLLAFGSIVLQVVRPAIPKDPGRLAWGIPILALVLTPWGVWLASKMEVPPALQGETQSLTLMSWQRLLWIGIAFVIFVWGLFWRNDSVSQTRWKQSLYYLMVVPVLGLVFALSLIQADQFYVFRNPHSFNAVFDANVQVYLGRPLLCRGLTHQYGLYPHFLEPLFRIIGLNVGSFSVVMQLLVVMIFGLFFRALTNYVPRLPWVMGIWLSILFAGCFLPFHNQWQIFELVNVRLDINYQFNPIRMTFPSLLIYFISSEKWFHGRRWWIAQALCAMAILWNLEFGLVVWLTWQAVLWYRAITTCGAMNIRGWLSVGLTSSMVGLATVAFAVVVFSIYIYVRYAEWPEWTQMLVYQNLFYRVGFGMLPMPVTHLWQAVVLVYAVGLTIAVYGAWAKDDSTWMRMTFGVSIFGCGCFAYYNGRSHDEVFLSICFPALILAGAILERWQASLSAVKQLDCQLASWSLIVPTAAWFALCAGSIVAFLPECRRCLFYDQRSTVLGDELKLVQKWAAKTKNLIVLSSNRSGLFWLETRRPCPIAAPSLVECLTQKQFNEWARYLKNGERRYFVLDVVDSKFMRSIVWPALEETLRNMPTRVLDSTPGKSVLIMEIQETGRTEP